MPWQDVQFLKMTCRTGPLGGSTCGRVGLPNIWAATGVTETNDITAATTTYNAEIAECAEKPRRILRDLCVLRVKTSSCLSTWVQTISRGRSGPVLVPILSCSMPNKCRMLNSMLDVLCVLSGNTMWRFPLNV